VVEGIGDHHPQARSSAARRPLEKTELLRLRQGLVECVAQEPGGRMGSAKMSDGDWLDDGFVPGSD
jgi:hypothetical protein